MPRLLIIILCFILVILGGYVFIVLEAYNSSPRLVLLVTLDTLRADYVGCDGNPEIYTPVLDKLSREGATFQRAYCQSPTTAPSHASILTSQYPLTHGLRANLEHQFDRKKTVFLTKSFLDNGYRCGAFISLNHLESEYDLTTEFHKVDSFKDDTFTKKGRCLAWERPGDITISKALKWLKKQGTQKCFVWLHLYDPHAPYAPIEPLAGLYQVDYDPYPPEHVDQRRLREPARIEGCYNPQVYRHLYQGEVATTDYYLANLMRGLQRLGLLEDALVILVSDHGEGFGEHDLYFDHSWDLHESSIRVPLVFWGKGIDLLVKMDTQIAETVDIAPTILTLCGREIPETYEGVSLTETSERPKFAKVEMGATEVKTTDKLLAVVGEGEKMLFAPNPDDFLWIDERYSFYDFCHDPAESDNLLEKMPPSEPMKEVFDFWLEAQIPETENISEMDEERLEALRSLGYISAPKIKGSRKKKRSKHTNEALTTSITLLKPEDNDVLPQAVEFDWEPVQNATSYDFYIQYKMLECDPVSFPIKNGTRIPLRVAEYAWTRMNEGRYVWYVEALDAKGKVIARSTEWRFDLPYQPPVDMTPLTEGETLILKATDLPGNVGKRVMDSSLESYRLGAQGKAAGYLCFGPEIELPAGRYELTCRFRKAPGGRAYIDVCVDRGPEVVARKALEEVTQTTQTWQEISIEFYWQKTDLFSARCWYDGNCDVRLGEFKLRRL